MNCIFCEIAKNPDKNVFLQGDFFYVKYDENPVLEGHCLIIPKRHVVSLLDLSEEEWAELRKVIKQATEQLNISEFNLGVNEGRLAGRTIDHLHWHVIPRKQGDADDPTGGIRNII